MRSYHDNKVEDAPPHPYEVANKATFNNYLNHPAL